MMMITPQIMLQFLEDCQRESDANLFLLMIRSVETVSVSRWCLIRSIWMKFQIRIGCQTRYFLGLISLCKWRVPPAEWLQDKGISMMLKARMMGLQLPGEHWFQHPRLTEKQILPSRNCQEAGIKRRCFWMIWAIEWAGARVELLREERCSYNDLVRASVLRFLPGIEVNSNEPIDAKLNGLTLKCNQSMRTATRCAVQCLPPVKNHCRSLHTLKQESANGNGLNVESAIAPQLVQGLILVLLLCLLQHRDEAQKRLRAKPFLPIPDSLSFRLLLDILFQKSARCFR